MRRSSDFPNEPQTVGELMGVAPPQETTMTVDEETVLRAWDKSKAKWCTPDGTFPAYAFAVFRDGFSLAYEAAKPVPASGGVEAIREALEFARRVIAGKPERSISDNLVIHRIDAALASSTPAATAPDAGMNAAKAARPIIAALIEAQYNVETWGLKQRLAAIDAALAPATEANGGRDNV